MSENFLAIVNSLACNLRGIRISGVKRERVQGGDAQEGNVPTPA